MTAFHILVVVGIGLDLVTLASVLWVGALLVRMSSRSAAQHRTNEALLISIEEYTRTVRHMLKGGAAATRLRASVPPDDPDQWATE